MLLVSLILIFEIVDLSVPLKLVDMQNCFTYGYSVQNSLRRLFEIGMAFNQFNFWMSFSVPTQQTPNLAATLQAAAHGGVAVTTAGNVRLNPMMVTVDPRHPSLSVQAQYASGSEGV